MSATLPPLERFAVAVAADGTPIDAAYVVATIKKHYRDAYRQVTGLQAEDWVLYRDAKTGKVVKMVRVG